MSRFILVGIFLFIPCTAFAQVYNPSTYRQNYENNLPRQHVCYYNAHGAVICD